MKNLHKLVYQFKITLQGIHTPLIWRRIQVPKEYSFWDLHVALVDAMGWLDYHLHTFEIPQSNHEGLVVIGIPENEFDEDWIAGWKIPLEQYFKQIGQNIPYRYDLGQHWRHQVLFEGILLMEKGVKYPRCTDGKNACPPEDCGGVSGYFRILEIINDPEHDEYQETIEWLRGHAINYYPYDPSEFNPQKIRFRNPKKQLQKILSSW